MALLSTHFPPILFLLPKPSLKPPNPHSLSLKPHFLSLKPLQSPQLKPHSLSLNLSRPAFLSPLRATFDIPISIQDKDYEEYLDSEPWKGAVVYKRDASVSHVEFCTSLDRLAVGWMSSRVSADRAALMGLKLRPNLEESKSDGDDKEEEKEEEEEEEEQQKLGDLKELFGDDDMIEATDENGNPILISGKELKDAEIEIEYANENGVGFDEDDIDDSDLDDDEDWVDTPVLVSLDVTRRKGRIRLDGIIRTVITLDCNRCLEPAAECVYANFSLLLSEEPIGDPPADYLDSIEEMFDDDNDEKSSKFSWQENEAQNGDEDKDIDWDDRLHFPSEDKEVDISKHIRDMIHLQVSMNGLCSVNCKGACFECGNNLNWSKCTCKKGEKGVKEANESDYDSEKYGPLKELRKRMEENYNK